MFKISSETFGNTRLYEFDVFKNRGDALDFQCTLPVPEDALRDLRNQIDEVLGDRRSMNSMAESVIEATLEILRKPDSGCVVARRVDSQTRPERG